MNTFARNRLGAVALRRLLVVALIGCGSWCPVKSVSAAGESPKIRAAINKAKQYLTASSGTSSGGEMSLAALALLKDGEKLDNAAVARGVKLILGKVRSSAYSPDGHIYESGVDLMVLANADPEKFRPQMQAIVNYVLKSQLSNGSWDYTSPDGGDTSMMQYALLGLWAAQRNGVEIPRAAVEKAASWMLKTQRPSGGFIYHPQSTGKHHAGEEELGITSAGISSVGITRVMLYPEVLQPQKPEPKRDKKRFGVLEQVNLDSTPDEAAKIKAGKSSIAKAALSGSLARGIGWLAQRFSVRSSPRYHMYYIYTLERAASLSLAQRVGNHDWYAEGSTFLVSGQSDDGSWQLGQSGNVPSTAFGVLFLVRATGKVMGLPEVGGGLLAGGRGLPDDLSETRLNDGKVEEVKPLGALDELLMELANTKDFAVADVQQAIVEKVQISTPEEREKLIEQKDLLLRLAKDKRDEVRRTAMWALGRTDDLQVAKSLLLVLKTDTNVDVLVEARNSLCALSRKPRGFGFPAGPYDALPESAADDQKRRALTEWRFNVFNRWADWYRGVRPYAERDELDRIGRLRKK
ncbi:MAG: hypothetical protein ABGZ17_29065 [Planctomycetaceae bacterium]